MHLVVKMLWQFWGTGIRILTAMEEGSTSLWLIHWLGKLVPAFGRKPQSLARWTSPTGCLCIPMAWQLASSRACKRAKAEAIMIFMPQPWSHTLFFPLHPIDFAGETSTLWESTAQDRKTEGKEHQDATGKLPRRSQAYITSYVSFKL